VSDEPKTKQELYEIADKEGMFICGDPACMDEETGIDYSHIEYLDATGKIDTHEARVLEKAWSHIWKPVENLMKSLVQAGNDGKDLQQENLEWRQAYAEQSTEMRIAKRFIQKTVSSHKKFINFRKRELEVLKKAMEKVIKEENERRENEMSKEVTTEAAGRSDTSSDSN